MTGVMLRSGKRSSATPRPTVATWCGGSSGWNRRSGRGGSSDVAVFGQSFRPTRAGRPPAAARLRIARQDNTARVVPRSGMRLADGIGAWSPAAKIVRAPTGHRHSGIRSVCHLSRGRRLRPVARPANKRPTVRNNDPAARFPAIAGCHSPPVEKPAWSAATRRRFLLPRERRPSFRTWAPRPSWAMPTRGRREPRHDRRGRQAAVPSVDRKTGYREMGETGNELAGCYHWLQKRAARRAR